MNPPLLIRHDLVLVGGGHAHAAVLKRFGMRPLHGLHLTLVSNTGAAAYSGMLPGLIAGHYQAHETHVELRPLCRFAGAQFIQAAVTGVDLVERRIHFNDRPSLAFDTLSLNTGSTPNLGEIRGALEHGLPVKPVHRFLADWPHLAQQRLVLPLAASDKRPRRLVVVGGGAGGFELLLALRHRLLQEISTGGQQLPSIEFHWVTAGETLLPNHSRHVQRTVSRFLPPLSIVVHTRQRVVEARSNELLCASGDRIPFDAAVWATHAAAPGWIAASGLATDPAGFVAVQPSLQSTSHPFVFAAGDVATILQHPRPKSGVFAVRQGPLLAENLRRVAQEKPLASVVPQKRALNLLSTGGRHAIASYGPFAFSGRWVWTVKDWIDRRWMRSYQELPTMSPAVPPAQTRANPTRPKANQSPASDASLHRRCGGCAAKVPSEVLARVLHRLQRVTHPDILIGLDAPDDAAVLCPPQGQVLVQSVDTLRAFIDDPYLLGRIAALHGLNDLFAMGAEPHSALAHATVPFGSPKAVEEILFQLLSGVAREFNSHRTALIGGHSSEGAELQMGVSVNGFASPDRLLRKAGLAPGDALILTKPLGTGTLFAADMMGSGHATWIDGAIISMLVSGQEAARCLVRHGAKACTDVSGFGLAGHLLEMLRASQVTANLRLDTLPALTGSLESFQKGILSSLHSQNVRLRSQIAAPNASAEQHPKFPLLFDPQTSGGLLAGIPSHLSQPCLDALHACGYTDACAIGEVAAAPPQPDSSPERVRLL